MKDRKRRIEVFFIYDNTGIEKHLEKMAAQGWLIEKCSSLTWVYRRIEPKKLHFAVTYYPKASEYDPEPLEGQLIYQDYAEQTGWHFVCSSAQMQIFCNEEEEPIPLETDPAVHVEVIHKAAKKRWLPLFFCLLATVIFQEILLGFQYKTAPVRFLASSSQCALVVFLVFCGLVYTAELIKYFRWHRKAVKAAENGEFLDMHGHMLFEKSVIIIAVAAFLYILSDLIHSTMFILLACGEILLAVFATVLSKFLKREKVSRTLNYIVTVIVIVALSIALMNAFVFSRLFSSWHDSETYEYEGVFYTVSHDELPLAIEDMTDIELDCYTREYSAYNSPFLEQHIASQLARYDCEDSKVPMLEYTVTDVKCSALYDFCKDRIMNAKKDFAADFDGRYVNSFHYEKVNPAPWLAKEAYLLYHGEDTWGTYVLCYDDTIIEILFINFEPTEEQMKTVAEKLAGTNIG